MNINALVNGLLIGGFYAVVALGLSLVFGVLRLINLAHGEILVAGAYLAFVIGSSFGLDPLLALPLVVVVVAVLGYVLQRYLLTGLLLKRPEGAMVATFGLALLGQGLFAQIFTSEPRSLNSPLATSGFTVLGIQTRTIYLVAFVLGAVLCVAMHLVLTRTRLGAMVRASAADPATAGLMGIDTGRVYAATFAAGAAIAAAGGVLVGITFSVTPNSGTQYLLVGIAVVVLGGVGNVLGTFLGAMFLGIVQSLAAAQFGGGYRDLTVYLLFFLVLAIRPQGLFVRRAT